MTTDLFTDDTPQTGATRLGPQAQVLRGFALPWVDVLWPALQTVVAQAPWRHMQTPGGQRMSVALTMNMPPVSARSRCCSTPSARSHSVRARSKNLR